MALLQEIIIDPPLDGLENMERDKNNFFKFNNYNYNGFIIRIYEWSSPTISLGISQKKDFLIPNADIVVVKRISGGKAVLHYKEVTYSIVSDYENSFFGGGLYQSYEKISNLLISFFREKIPKIKVEQFGSSEKSNSPICYLAKGFKEICLEGKKFIGSAQKRGKRAFLQHGSIPVIRHSLTLENYVNDKTKQKLNSLTNSKDKLPDSYVFLNDFIPDVSISSLKLELKKYLTKNLYQKEEKEKG